MSDDDDEGLMVFYVSGKQAVLVDELNFCGDGNDCIHGVNCATGYTHEVTIYLRNRESWTKVLKTYVSGPVHLSVEYGTQNFKALVLDVFDGTWGCQVRKDVPAVNPSRDACHALVRWTGERFVPQLIK